MEIDAEGFCTDYRFFGSAKGWRIERKTFISTDTGKTITKESLVPPNYHVTLDKGMKYRYAEPKPVSGKFYVYHNGYVLSVINEDGRVAADIDLPGFRENKNRDGYTLEECVWIAEKIVACLNNKSENPSTS